MARRRLLKSYFYVEYNGQKYLNGGTATVPPFEATGGTGSFTVHSSRAWEINNKPSWISLDNEEGKRGSTLVNMTASTNSGAGQRTGELHVGLKCFLDTRNINVALSQQAIGSAYITVAFVNNPVNASATANTFTLSCSEINMATLGYYEPESSGISSCNMANSSVTFSQNSGYTDRTITLAISGLSIVGQFVSGSATFVQSKTVVTPSLSIAYTGTGETAAAGSTSAFTLTKNYITTITRYAVSPTTASVSNTGQTGVTVQFPANQTNTAKTYTLSVSGTDVYGTTKTASTTFNQAADSYTLRLSPTAYTAASTDVQYSYSIVSSNVSSIGVSDYTGAITAATKSGNNVVVNFTQNQTQSDKTGSVTISGKTVGGRTVTATANLTQAAAGAVTLTIVYNGGDLTPESGSTNDFTITAVNVTVTGYSANNDATVSNTGATAVTLNYPANSGNTVRPYTVKVLGRDEFNTEVSGFCIVEQVADSYSFSVSAHSSAISWDATQAKFTTSQTNVSNVGYYSATSQNINSCTKNGNEYTATVSANDSSNERTIKFVASGKTRAGRTVYATGTTIQEGKPAAGNLSVTPDGTQIGSGATSVTFVVAWTGLSVGSQITLNVSSAITSTPSPINVGNNTASSVTVTVNISANPTTSARNAALSASGIDNLSSARTDTGYYRQAGKQATYSLTFLMPQTGDTLSCGLNGASQSVVATNATSYTITGLVVGDTVAYTMTKAGYVSATSSITMGNSDETLTLNLFTNDFHFAVTPGNTPDTNNNLFKVTFLADDTFVADAVLTGNSENSGLGQYHFTLPNNYVMNGFGQNSGDFTYQIEYLTGGINIVSAYVAAIEVGQSTTASSLSEANAFMGNMGILKAKFIRLAYYGTYPSGNFSVTPDAGSIDSATTGAVFTITYQNLAAPSIITVQAGTNVTGLSETQIQVSTTGQATTTVTAYCTTNQSQSQRAIQIEASGTSMVGPILHDGGTYYQEAAAPQYNPSISWDVDSLTLPSYIPNNYEVDDIISSATFSYVDIDSVNVDILTGSGFEVGPTTSGNSTGTTKIETGFNKGSVKTLGTVRISGHGMDNQLYWDDIVIRQAAGVTPILTIAESASGIYEVSSGAGSNNFTVEFAYIDTGSSSFGWYYSGSSSGNVTAVTLDRSGGHLLVEWDENDTPNDIIGVVCVSSVTVYGDSIKASIAIRQEGYNPPVVTTSITWVYGVHFYGTHAAREVITFQLKHGSTTYATVTLDTDDYSYGSNTTVGDYFSASTTVTLPSNVVTQLEVTDNKNYYWSYYEYSGTDPFKSTLYVPSQTEITFNIIAQAYRGIGGGAAFPVKFTVQNLNPEQIQYGPTSALNSTVLSVGPAEENAIRGTASYTASTFIRDFTSRMGCWLEIVVDTAVTGSFTDLMVWNEDIVNFPVAQKSSTTYWVFLGNTQLNVDNKTLYVKFIDAEGYTFTVSSSAPKLSISNKTSSAATIGGYQIFAQNFQDGGNNHTQFTTGVTCPANSSVVVDMFRTRETTYNAFGVWVNWNVSGVPSNTPIYSRIQNLVFPQSGTDGRQALTGNKTVAGSSGEITLIIGEQPS